MALANYGVLRGSVSKVTRQDDDPVSPHLHITVAAGKGQFDVPVNVKSSQGKGVESFVVFHRVDPLEGHPILDGLDGLKVGVTKLPVSKRNAGTSLDYFRAPLFDWETTGVALPPSQDGTSDDLQDLMLADLEQVQLHDGEVFAFGETFKGGMHDIHMNQGNAKSGKFAQDNGVFQDGGLILRLDNRHIGLFLRFQSQWLPTDDATGHPTKNAQHVPPAGVNTGVGQPIGGGQGKGGPTPVAVPDVYVERALVNPAGDDVGKEVVVIGNSTTRTFDLTGWAIEDKNKNVDVIGGVILPGGSSVSIALSGDGAQLGNGGGSVRLLDADGMQVHAVSYSAADTNEPDRYIRFVT